MTPEEIEKIRKLCDKNFKIGTFPETISKDEMLYLGGCAGGMLDLIDQQAADIKRLEAENYQWRSYNHELGNKSHKQRLALKKLGEKVRARGKALVEERARQIAERESGDFVNSRGEHMYQQIDPATRAGLARDHLRAEGVIR